jgi:hypothetical protein
MNGEKASKQSKATGCRDKGLSARDGYTSSSSAAYSKLYIWFGSSTGGTVG